MKLIPHAKNMNTIAFDDGRLVLISYQTKVAVFIPGKGVKRTMAKYSNTTTRHINRWLEETFSPNVTVEMVSQSDLEQIAQEAI